MYMYMYIMNKQVYKTGSIYLFDCIHGINISTCERDERRKEERSKQGHTNNKAKQHSTPKHTGLGVKVLQIFDPHSLQRQLQLHSALTTVAVGKHQLVVEEDALVELLDVLEVALALFDQASVRGF